MQTAIIPTNRQQRIKHITGVIRLVSQYTIKGNRILQLVNSKGRVNVYVNDALYTNVAQSFPVKTAVKLRFTNPKNIQFISLSKLN